MNRRRTYASPPCMAGEVDPVYVGLLADDATRPGETVHLVAINPQFDDPARNPAPTGDGYTGAGTDRQ